MNAEMNSDNVKDVSVHECWDQLKKEKASILIDVRTEAERIYVGTPDLSSLGKEIVFVEWQKFPSQQVNPDFTHTLADLLGRDHARPLFFICRSGARSRAAGQAMRRENFSACFNVQEGFEGGLDENGHRGQKTGWKASGLPWRQY